MFARRGLGEARHAEIAEEAGVSLSAVFVYFPTRALLVAAVLDEVARFLIEMGREVHARDLPAPRALLEHARTFADSVDTHPDHARVWLDWSTSVRAEIWPRYLDFQRAVAETIEATIARGQREGTIPAHVEPEPAALLIVGAAHMVAQLKLSEQDATKLERFLNTLVRSVTGGRGERPAP